MVKKMKKQKEGAFWVAVEGMVDADMQPMKVDNIPFRVKGVIGNAVHVEVPPTVTSAQAERLSKIVEDATGHPPIVMTNNARFIKLRRLTPQEAHAMADRVIAEQAGPPPAPPEVADVIKKIL